MFDNFGNTIVDNQASAINSCNYHCKSSWSDVTCEFRQYKVHICLDFGNSASLFKCIYRPMARHALLGFHQYVREHGILQENILYALNVRTASDKDQAVKIIQSGVKNFDCL